MQIKPATGPCPPIDIQRITKLDRNIEAGVKYLHFLGDQCYKDQPMTRLSKGLFVFSVLQRASEQDWATAKGSGRCRLRPKYLVQQC